MIRIVYGFIFYLFSRILPRLPNFQGPQLLIFKNQLKINHQNNNKWSVSITFGYFLMLKGLKRIDNNCKFRAIYDSEYMIQKDTKMMIIIVQKRIKEFVKNSHIIICLLCLISDLFLSTMWPSQRQPIAVSASKRKK